jgi:vancomycin resistance protein VanW
MARKPLSVIFPQLAPHIRQAKVSYKNIKYLQPKYHLKKDETSSHFRIYKHKSLLRRRLGDSDPKLQEQKVENLQIAVDHFNNRIIKPNQVFSFWKLLGNPIYERGFVDGMILADGKVTIGVGGGLCQIANLLYWLCLHSPLTVKEHHHHQLDIFPDSGRVLPFGSGAGVFYNYGDLQFANLTKLDITIKTWLDEEFLHGEIYSNKPFDKTYKIKEKEHYFYEKDGQTYRTNKLYRVVMLRQGGIKLAEELVTKNNSRVLYKVEEERIRGKINSKNDEILQFA